MKVIRAGTLLTMRNNKVLEDINIVIEGDKIVEIKGGPPPDADEVIDARDHYVMPSFYDAHTHIGVAEEGAGFDYYDINEATDPATPGLQGKDAIYPGDIGFKDAQAAGVSVCITGPGSSNVIGGLQAVIRTKGNTVEEMIIKEPVGLKMSFGRNPQFYWREQKKFPSTRMGVSALIREYFEKARNYRKKKEKDKTGVDPNMEALLLVLDRKIPARIHVANMEDISTIFELQDEYNIDITLEHVTEGHLIVDEIAKRDIPCVVGPFFVAGKSLQTRFLTARTAAILSEKGVRVALMTDHPAIPIHFIRHQAALAYKAGMDKFKALEAITSQAAEIIGIGDQYGTVEEGKKANIVILSDDPFKASSRVLYHIMEGEIVWKES